MIRFISRHDGTVDYVVFEVKKPSIMNIGVITVVKLYFQDKKLIFNI